MSLLEHQQVYGATRCNYPHATVIPTKPTNTIKKEFVKGMACSQISKKHPTLWREDGALFADYYAADYQYSRKGVRYLGHFITKAEYKVKTDGFWPLVVSSVITYDLVKKIITSFLSKYHKDGYKSAKKYTMGKFSSEEQIPAESRHNFIMTSIVFACRFINVYEVNDKCEEIQPMDCNIARLTGVEVASQSFLAKITTDEVRGLMMVTQSAMRYALNSPTYINRIIIITINIKSNKITSYKINPWRYIYNMIDPIIPPGLGVTPLVSADEFNKGLEDARNCCIIEGSISYQRGIKFYRDFEEPTHYSHF